MTEQLDAGRNPGSTSPSIDPAFPAPTEDEGEVRRVPDPQRPSRVPVAAVVAWAAAGAVLIAVSVLALLAAGRIGVPVTVTVDGFTETVRSTRPDVGALLADLGLALRPEDRLTPRPDTPLTPGMSVTVTRARPGLVNVDGRLAQVYVQAGSIGEMVAAADVRLGAHDEVWLDGRRVTPDAPLPPAAYPAGTPRYARSRAWAGMIPPPVRLSIRRAVPIVVDDGSVPYTLFTTEPTVGEALLGAQLTLYLGDRVRPGLGTPVSAGMRVAIERSTPVFVTADGHTTHTRTRGKSVGGTLMDLGVVVAGSDRVTPPLNQPVVDQQQIRVTRVAHVTLVELKPIPYESIMVPDDNLEIDRQRLAQAGGDGEFRQRYKVLYEDGKEISRTLVDEWTAAEPVTRMVAYGRKIVSRQLDTPDGPVNVLAQDPHVRHVLLAGPFRHADHCALVRPHSHRPPTSQGHRRGRSQADPASNLGVRAELRQSHRRRYRRRCQGQMDRRGFFGR